jgi:hypothetical protein
MGGLLVEAFNSDRRSATAAEDKNEGNNENAPKACRPAPRIDRNHSYCASVGTNNHTLDYARF